MVSGVDTLLCVFEHECWRVTMKDNATVSPEAVKLFVTCSEMTTHGEVGIY